MKKVKVNDNEFSFLTTSVVKNIENKPYRLVAKSKDKKDLVKVFEKYGEYASYRAIQTKDKIGYYFYMYKERRKRQFVDMTLYKLN